MNISSAGRVQPDMKLAFLVLAAAMSPAMAGDLTQTNQVEKSGMVRLPSAASTNQPGGLRLWNSGSDSNHFIWNSGSTNPPIAGLQYGWKLPTPDGNPPPAGLLRPGVYRTSPYTCLVLVPGPQYDRCAIGDQGPAGLEKMLVIQGGLKFIPYSFTEKQGK